MSRKFFLSLFFLFTIILISDSARGEMEGPLLEKIYPVSWDAPEEDSERIDRIMNAVIDHCGKYSWDVDGGPGMIEWTPEGFVILQTPEVHEKISRFFEAVKNPPTRMPGPETEWEKRLAEILVARVSLEYDKKPLGEIAEDLSERFGLPVKLHPRLLEEEGIRETDQVSFSVNDISLENALRGMLFNAFGSYATILAERDVLWITSRDHTEKTLVTRFYPWDLKLEKRKRVYRRGGMMSGDYGGFGFNLVDDLSDGDVLYQWCGGIVPFPQDGEDGEEYVAHGGADVGDV